MATPPSREAILNLYHTMLRTSRSFSSYNFREYFVRRTKDTFRQIQAESDPNRVRNMYTEAAKELSVLRRSAIVNQLYGGWRLAVEAVEKEKEPGEFKTRGDN
ncbi:putative complex I LYR family protein [Lyophyllum shimeji]|uniref:Complex I LYR family protein n=1 Tax=Lyophyllum shimeji TaxID=47721 RepID=A0A9P3UNL1_LYOSH|nr:putative complex I LYR family protein [Lyophyllum shimeji]